MQKNIKKNSVIKRGYITLISILIIGAIGLSIVVSIVLLGVGSSRTSATLERANEAKALANACGEKALQQIWNSDSYVGTGNLTFGQGTCSFVVTGTVAPKTILASGSVGTIVRKISITLDQLRPYLHTSSWQEVP